MKIFVNGFSGFLILSFRKSCYFWRWNLMKALRYLNLLLVVLLLLNGSPVQSAPPPPESLTTTTTPQLVEESVAPQRVEESIAPQPAGVTPLSEVKTGYIFSSSSGTYAELTSGLINSGGSFMTGATIGFTFHYNGVAYTDVRISSEGFVLMGDGPVSNSYCAPNPIGSPNSFCANALAPLGMAYRSEAMPALLREMLALWPAPDAVR